jgi:ArsR family transcriptional regulator
MRKAKAVAGLASTKQRELSDEAMELLAARFRLLSEPTRLRILHALGRDEMTVGQLVEATGAGQANVSKHLAILLDGGLISRRKQGLNAFYRVADATVFDLCDAVCTSLADRLAAQHSAVRRFARS